MALVQWSCGFVVFYPMIVRFSYFLFSGRVVFLFSPSTSGSDSLVAPETLFPPSAFSIREAVQKMLAMTAKSTFLLIDRDHLLHDNK